MPDSPAERTEQPTPRRILKARGEGQVPQSQEMMSVASLVVLVAMIFFMAPALMRWLTAEVAAGMSCQTSVFASSESFLHFINTKLAGAALVVLPIIAALVAGSIFMGIAISGPNFAPGAIKLKWDVVNPAAGLKKLFNTESMVKLLLSILKLLFVSLVVWFYLRDRLDEFLLLRWAWSTQIMAGIAKIIGGLMIRICLALLVIGLADLFYRKWKHIEDLKMTKQEVKQERRDTDGAPEVKGRIRKLQLQMSLKRMLQEVPKATVVLVNPTHVAVALRYEGKTMEAPVVVAKGADHMAEKIREIARAYGVPVVRKPELARALYSTVKLDESVPNHLYMAVAEILAMIYRLRQQKTQKR